ncbi:DUF4855 domain-containing protein [Aneurinibacillus tyrosinisolvens]|uniref:DUF4855 domain-containing protein n=1 Tax=Aneurinibacillus tyrosinisolvens TaxID=1443435 RepID=UPI00063F19C5|nr:DUF4855 domain-containing protein [Aneurinibacillus tyrosinisolvens]
MRAVLIYIGNSGTNGPKYPAHYTPYELNVLPESIDTLIIAPLGDGEYIYGDTTGYNSGVTSRAAESVRYFVQNVFKASTMAARGVKLHIGYPGIDIRDSKTTGDNRRAHSLKGMQNYYGIFVNFYKAVQTNLGTDWTDYVEGCYNTIETVYPKADRDVSAARKLAAANSARNPTASLFGQLSTYVHGLGKKFSWAPYYGYGRFPAEIIWNIGVLVNRTNYFDFCMMQPHYYFHASDESGNLASNLTGIRYSIVKNAITYRDGVVAAGPRTHTLCKIGVDMEISSVFHRNGVYDSNGVRITEATVPANKYGQLAGCRHRYYEYEATFKDFVKDPDVPFMFYAGARGELLSDLRGQTDSQLVQPQSAIYQVIGDFYSH